MLLLNIIILMGRLLNFRDPPNIVPNLINRENIELVPKDWVNCSHREWVLKIREWVFNSINSQPKTWVNRWLRIISGIAINHFKAYNLPNKAISRDNQWNHHWRQWCKIRWIEIILYQLTILGFKYYIPEWYLNKLIYKWTTPPLGN